MYYEILTNLGKPTLVCVPGLLGGPEDFRGIVQEIHLRFQIIFVNPNQERRERGLFQLSREETEAVSFDSSAEEIKDLPIKYEIEKLIFLE